MIRFLMILWFVCAQALTFAASSPDFTVIEDPEQISILTPSFSGQQTLKLRLKNGLEAYIISDPKVDKSSAALVVKTGSWEDPEGYAGTAHFLEHVLFLGTKKYPGESEYSHFLSQHGGTFNAFTTSDFTGYMFTVEPSAFPEALDRLSDFFVEPLFNPSGVARELNAIDQEYAKNVEDDDIRQYYVLKELMNPSHPNHSFDMGNHTSLLKVSQDSLKEWYKQHYSANRMRLVVISSLPLEKLKELVVSEFLPVPNINLPPFDFREPMLPGSILGHMIYVKPIKQVRTLNLVWELPPEFADMRDSKPERLVAYVLGHEGKNSLLSELKRQKLASAIVSGGEKIGGHNMLFYLQIELTDFGVKHVDDAIKMCFESIAGLRKKGIPHYLFEESQQMALLNYQYQVRGDSFGRISSEASRIANESIETYPRQTLFIKEFDPKAVDALLQILIPSRCVFMLMAPEVLTGVVTDTTEKWLGAQYKVEAIPSEILTEWAQATPNSRVDLPELNPFVPMKMTLLYKPTKKEIQEEKVEIPHPRILVDDDFSKIYFSQDSIYAVPKISWSFQIRTPLIREDSPESIVLGDLYVKSIVENFNVYAYAGLMAGLNFSMTRTDNGVLISIDGFSDKAGEFFLKLVKSLKDSVPKEQQFKVFKESLLHQYQNAALDKPLMQAGDVLKSLLYKDYVTEQKKAVAIKKITFERFEDFISKVFEQSFVEGMLYGNMSEDEAHHLIKQLSGILDGKGYPKKEQYEKTFVVLPQSQGPFFLETKSKAQGNATILAIQAEPFSFKERAAQQILMQAMKEPFFSTLRTKQQTGYIVMSKTEELEKHIVDYFAVQSNTHDGRDLLARFELFIEGFIQEIVDEGVTEEKYNNIHQSLVRVLREPAKDIAEMGALLTKLAFTYDGDFDWITKRIQGYEDLSYMEFLGHARRVMGKKNKQRLAILLNGVMPEDSTLQYQKVGSVAEFKKLQ